MKCVCDGFNNIQQTLGMMKAELGTKRWDFANILYQVNHDQTGNNNDGYVYRDVRENKRIRKLDGAKRVEKRRMNYLRENWNECLCNFLKCAARL